MLAWRAQGSHPQRQHRSLQAANGLSELQSAEGKKPCLQLSHDAGEVHTQQPSTPLPACLLYLSGFCSTFSWRIGQNLQKKSTFHRFIFSKILLEFNYKD